MGEMLTAERARELFRYEPKSGKLYWRKPAGNGRTPAGAESGWVAGPIDNLYRRVKIDGRTYVTHRIIWLIVTGVWPVAEIDHIDGDGLNNRWGNLREASRIDNCRNTKRRNDNASGITGVGWYKACRKWRARIRVNGTVISLGYFDDLDDAADVRKAAERQYGFHRNHGRG